MAVTLPAELNRIRSVVQRPEPERADNEIASAVLVPLVEFGGDLAVLFTARSADLPLHPGEISFPGGKVEPDDSGPRAAALRETHEETGIPPNAVEVLGHLLDFRTFRGDLVCAYVGLIPASRLPDPPHVSPEVEEALLVPLWELRAPGRSIPKDQDAYLTTGVPLPVARVKEYEARIIQEAPPAHRLIHYWHLDNGRTIWGITGGLLANFLTRTYGWRQPSAPRPVEGGEVEP